jgi:5-methylthioadenosine/S-adenosylhomocysteine deaminase
VTILIKGVLLEGAVRDILIENGVIIEISPSCTRSAHRTIDGTGKAALPSLIKVTPAAMTLFRGYAETICPEIMA